MSDSVERKRRARLAADALTIGRMVGAVGLVLVPPFSVMFFVVYAACGLSDVLDGWIVRRVDAATLRGAALDSAADLLFTIAILVALLPQAQLPGFIWAWVAAIAMVKVLSLFVGYQRFRAYAALHTYANKAAGFALFALPVLFACLGSVFAACIICAIASLAAVEELFLTTMERTLDRDTKGLLFELR